jgi:glycosyltransferase involved in cell wall biosynthesis
LILNNYDIDCLVLQDKIPCIERTAGSSNIFIANFQPDRKSSRASDQGRTNSRNTKGESEEFDENKSSFKAVVICSFAPDEPIVEVVDAAKILPEVTFYLTGDNSQAKWLNKESASSNVIFTGYLNKEDYFSLLREADTIVVLTKRDNTMLSGAYEAVALCKPLITSNWPVLKNYFDRGTIHVNNDSEEIKNAIMTVMIKGSQLEKEIKQLKEIRTKEWNNQFINFKALLSDNAKSL